MTTTPTDQPARALDRTLWTLQTVFFLLYAGTAVWKLATPPDELAGMIPWAGDVPWSFLAATALVDLAGGLGVLLPSVTRITPWLAPVAAGGLAALQASAIVFHVVRGEAADTPFNVVLLVLALVALWGRGRRAPIVPRRRPPARR
jgi:hypothetical protein